MAGGFKHGCSRGGTNNGFKKSYAKKRSPEEGTDAVRANKKSKVGEEEEEEENAGTPIVPKLQTDEDENPFVALNHNGKRRVTVSSFKGVTLVSIREYWTNDEGELKPGKKGISLSIEQYNALLTAAPLLESVLSKKEFSIARPDYNTGLDTTSAAQEQHPVDDGEEEN